MCSDREHLILTRTIDQRCCQRPPLGSEMFRGLLFIIAISNRLAGRFSTGPAMYVDCVVNEQTRPVANQPAQSEFSRWPSTARANWHSRLFHYHGYRVYASSARVRAEVVARRGEESCGVAAYSSWCDGRDGDSKGHHMVWLYSCQDFAGSGSCSR